MTDSFTETTSRSWFSRLGSSFSGILFGIGLIIAAVVLLFWNEGRAVKRDKTLREGAGLVVSVPADVVKNENNKKLVHMSGDPVVKDVLRDDAFGISANAVRLERQVEMLQWNEITESKTRNKLGGGTETVTTYKYELKWSEREIDSAKFRHPQGHENKPKIALSSKNFQAKDVKVGAFNLSQSQIGRIGELQTLPLTSNNVPKNLPMSVIADVVDGVMYIGSSSHNKAGDVRVTMQVAKTSTISLVAQQTGNTFTPYRTSVGGTISLLASGNKPATEMFAKAVSDNNILTWILRIVGLVLLFIGFKMMLGVLSVFGSIIPFLGTIVGTAVSLVAFLLAICLGFIVIAIAWIFYRPLIGIALLVLGIAAGVFAIMRARKDTRQETGEIAA